MTKVKIFLKKLFQQRNYCCVCCGREVFDEEDFCQHCLKSFPFNHKECCQICGRQVKEEVEICEECRQDRPIYTMAKSSFVYSDEIRKLLYRFKNGDRYLADAFAPFADYFLASEIFDVDYLVYVPMYTKDERRRGYNQAEYLAKAISARCNIPVASDKIIKIRQTMTQKSLKKSGRMQNLKESFVIVEKEFFEGKRILLIDDILTTGATSETITKVLKEGGCSKVYLYTIASVPLQK